MPPELLGRFYDAYCQGLADFINGSRLLYPMEGEAMRFLNHLGNVFFARRRCRSCSIIASQIRSVARSCRTPRLRAFRRLAVATSATSTLSGTYELLFPASIFALGIVDVPIRYRARTYGATNIKRFHHGWMLLKMTFSGFFRVRVGPWRT
jgi:hypothetical protein